MSAENLGLYRLRELVSNVHSEMAYLCDIYKLEADVIIIPLDFIDDVLGLAIIKNDLPYIAAKASITSRRRVISEMLKSMMP